MKLNVAVGTVAGLLAFAVLGVSSECCKRTAMYWTANNCYPYEEDFYMQSNNEADLLSSMMLPTRCKAKVCGDGRVHDGFYCGVGKCNIFGCDCDGGCLKGDAQENFIRLTGISDADGGFAFKDPTTWGRK